MSLREIVIKRFLNLVEDGPKNKRDELVLSFLEVLEGIYEKGAVRRAEAYAAGMKKAASFDAVVISLGNITVGGRARRP